MSERWQLIDELFSAALERRPSERRDFLLEACAGDGSLLTEIESLLSSYDGAGVFLEDGPVVDLMDQSRVMAGRRIGAYRIVRECGHGGMAVVYVAERADDEYRKRVAIKMVRPGIDRDEILRRFRNERQALAALDHPNIVRLLDGGSTGEGLPYLVMDYVEGSPVDAYCDSHRLSIFDRLRLFRTVCDAVQYAHDNHLIHRDLKPSNILVTPQGVPRLLDFGIAKVLDPEGSQDSTLTRGNWRPMTPQYASPEQIRGEPITHATDIYSLGVLLYELLTGHRPYRLQRASSLEIERLVCAEEPEKPSTAASQIEESASDDDGTQTAVTPQLVSEARACEPEELRRRLRGDLDTIVMKALCKEAQRRYSSARAFSGDIERHLSGMPITARKATVAYRGGKFIRRHAESLVTAIFILAIVAGLGTWQARRLWKQRNMIQQPDTLHVRVRPSVAILGFKNLSNEQETAWVSTALSEMITAQLAAGEQLRAVPEDTVARTKVDLSLSDAESLGPEALMQVRQGVGSDFVILGSYLESGEAGRHEIRLDLRIEDTSKGETVLTVSEAGSERNLPELVSRVGSRLRQQFGLEQLSDVELAAVRTESPSNSEAIRFYSQGLARLRAFDALSARDLLGHAVASDPSFPLAHSAMARAWSALGYESNSQLEARRALDEASNLSREKHLLVEAGFYEVSKDWGKAIEAYQTLFSFFPDNLEFGLYLANAQSSGGAGKQALATIEQLRRMPKQIREDPQIDLAQALAAHSLADDKNTVDAAERAAMEGASEGARLLVARARSLQCRALANLGQARESSAACEEARRIFQEAGDLAGVVAALHATAEVPLNQGDLEQAKKYYLEALSIARRIGFERGVAAELGNLALIYAEQGDLAAAERTYQQATASARKVSDRRIMAVDLGNIGDLLRAEGRLTEAVAHYKEALALARQVGHKSSEAMDIQLIGNVVADQGDLPGALQMYQQALHILREIGERSNYATTLAAMGRALRQQGDSAGAAKAYDEALSIQQQLGEKGSAAETQLAMADLACDAGLSLQAESLAQAASQEFHAENERDWATLAEVLLSKSLYQQAKLDEARKAMARAMAVLGKGKNVMVRLPLEIENAYLLAAEKDASLGEQTARSAFAQASKLGFLSFQFEAALALGEIQMQGKNAAAGHARLSELENNARAKGFELIARKAAAM
jgi:eukaryotic-like serine/threonine-protein kinase